MPDFDVLELIGLVLRFLTFVFSLVFVIRYSRRPWRSLPEGRHLMGFSTVVCAFMAWSLVNTVTAWLDPSPPEIRPDGHWPGRELVAVILFGFTAWYMLQRNLLLEPESKAREAIQAEDDLHDDRVSGVDRDDVVDTKEN